jgi:hypothetical protein
MLYAVEEAFRHIYRVGTRERILVDVSSADYLAADRERFAAWLVEQQSAFRSVADRAAVPPNISYSGAPSPQSESCATAPGAPIEELNIDHRGWGHRSIIMINYAAKRDEDERIKNPTLRTLCSADDESIASSDRQLFREMKPRVSCAVMRNDQNQWLILSSRQAPSQTGQEMRRYAQEIKRSLDSDRCVYPELRIFVVNFLQEN